MDVKESLDQFEEQIERLKYEYEQYFLGFQKRPPEKLHGEVERTGRRFAPTQITNTSLRFRYQQLMSRLITYKQYWVRTCRQIEEGTYRRHVFRANHHAPSPPPQPRPPGADGAAPAENAGKRLYDAYIEARQRCGESIEGLSPDKLSRIVAQQSGRIKEKYHCKSVEFKVAIEGGKARLKAIPKR